MSRWDAVLPYLPPGRGSQSGACAGRSLRVPAVGSPRSPSLVSTSSSDCDPDDGAFGSRLPDAEDIYDLHTTALAALEERLGARVRAQQAPPREMRLHELVKIELKERRNVEEIGLALVGGRFDLGRVPMPTLGSGGLSSGKVGVVPAVTSSPRASRDPLQQRPPFHQPLFTQQDAPSPSSSSRSMPRGFDKSNGMATFPAPSFQIARLSDMSVPPIVDAPFRDPASAVHANVTAPVDQCGTSPGRSDVFRLAASGPAAGNKSAAFKPTPVDFDFVIGRSSVKKVKPRPKPKRKAPADETRPRQEEKGGNRRVQAKPPLAPAAGVGTGGARSRDPGAARRTSAAPGRSRSADPRCAAKPGDRKGQVAGGAVAHAGICGGGAAGMRNSGVGVRSPSSPPEMSEKGAAPPRTMQPSLYHQPVPPLATMTFCADDNARVDSMADWELDVSKYKGREASHIDDAIAASVAAVAFEQGTSSRSRCVTPTSAAGAGVKVPTDEEECGDGYECDDGMSLDDHSAGSVAEAALRREAGAAITSPAQACQDRTDHSDAGDNHFAEAGARVTPSPLHEAKDAKDITQPCSSRSLSNQSLSFPSAPLSAPRCDEFLEVVSRPPSAAQAVRDLSEGGLHSSSGARATTPQSVATDASEDLTSKGADRPGSGCGHRSPPPLPPKSPTISGASIAVSALVPTPMVLAAAAGGVSPSTLASASPAPHPRPSSDEEAGAVGEATGPGSSGVGLEMAEGCSGSSHSRPRRSKRDAKALFDAAQAAGEGNPTEQQQQQRPARRPPLPHDVLRAAREPTAPRVKQAFELDLMGVDPTLVARGGVTSYAEYYPTIQSVFTWGRERCADTAEKRDRYLRDAFDLFSQFCHIIQCLESQFKRELVPVDSATPGTTQQVLSAMNSRGAGLYGVFLKGVIDKVSDAASPSVPRPLSAKDAFSTRYYKVVQNRTEVYDIVTRVFHNKEGWEELPHGLGLANAWNLCWTWSHPKLDFSRLCVWQKVNHFPQNKHLTRKDCLKRCFDRYLRLGGKLSQYFRICPQTFVLPREYCLFIDTFQKVAEAGEEENGDAAEDAEPGGAIDMGLREPGAAGASDVTHSSGTRCHKAPNLWIMKPAGSSRGRGIEVINDLGAVSYGEITIIQQYISNPFLLGGFKWDMRVYVTVTSFNPLEAFIYRDGFARFTTVPFNTDSADIDNKFVHLTNSSIQRHNEDSMMQGNHADPSVQARQRDAKLGGTKISFGMLRDRLQAQGVSWKLVWSRMIEVVLKSLAMAEGHIPNQANSFELFGYDLLLDSKLRIWLIEVNSSPSMGQEHLLDEQVKQPLIAETIDLIEPMSFDRRRLAEALHRRVERKAATGAAGGQQQLDIDLHSILEGKTPRRFGELPERMGNYERIAPSEAYNIVVKYRDMCFQNKAG